LSSRRGRVDICKGGSSGCIGRIRYSPQRIRHSAFIKGYVEATKSSLQPRWTETAATKPHVCMVRSSSNLAILQVKITRGGTARSRQSRVSRSTRHLHPLTGAARTGGGALRAAGRGSRWCVWFGPALALALDSPFRVETSAPLSLGNKPQNPKPKTPPCCCCLVCLLPLVAGGAGNLEICIFLGLGLGWACWGLGSGLQSMAVVISYNR
jgi:hypothetical protein